MNRIFISAIAALTAMSGVSTLQAKPHEPNNNPRLMWDISSKKQIFTSGNYARLIPLADGRLMAAAESGSGVSVSYSSDEGVTWSTPERIIQNPGQVNYAVPDLVQLSNGTILVGFNPRPNQPFSEDRRFGIRTMRSTDNGATWEGPIHIFDASHAWDDGCWEPSFLEIPGTGEIHCYFANEFPFTQSNEQEISLCRSFDDGLTWSEPERVCFRPGHRDGMPSAIITDAGEIVVIVEDNGYPRGFRATTMRCSLDQNWHDCWVDQNSPNRHVIFADNDEDNMQYISAAPYIRKLNTGETLASWQGDHWDRIGLGEGRFDMFVAVGDPDARNFTQVSQPFGLDKSHHALWNSINVGAGNDVYALASIGSDSEGNAINLMKGYAVKSLEADFGTPQVDGSSAREEWTRKGAAQVLLGALKTRSRANADFLYDNDNLYFYVRVVDRDIFTDKIDNDGVYLYLDVRNACDTYPQEGTFRIFMNVNGQMEWSAGNANRWTPLQETPASVGYVANVSKTYYQLEAAIPWKALGLDEAPSPDDIMRCNVEVRDRRSGEMAYEAIPETAKNASWTWPEFRLNKNEDSGISETLAPETAQAMLTLSGQTLDISSPRPMKEVVIYSISGVRICSQATPGESASINLPVPGQIVIAEVMFADHTTQHAKLAVAM